MSSLEVRQRVAVGSALLALAVVLGFVADQDIWWISLMTLAAYFLAAYLLAPLWLEWLDRRRERR